MGMLSKNDGHRLLDVWLQNQILTFTATYIYVYINIYDNSVIVEYIIERLINFNY
jgi:hypothetical protein